MNKADYDVPSSDVRAKDYIVSLKTIKLELGMAAEEPTVSADDAFKLRDAKWSDGTPVTTDFVFCRRLVGLKKDTWRNHF